MVRRISVTLPEDIMGELDRVMAEMNIRNRSKFVTEAVVSYISGLRWTSERGRVAGTITIIYNHTEGDVVSRLTHLQHTYLDIIRSVIHVHLSPTKCLESINVAGDVLRAKRLFFEVKNLRGVLCVKQAIFPVEGEGPHTHA